MLRCCHCRKHEQIKTNTPSTPKDRARNRAEIIRRRGKWRRSGKRIRTALCLGYINGISFSLLRSLSMFHYYENEEEFCIWSTYKVGHDGYEQSNFSSKISSQNVRSVDRGKEHAKRQKKEAKATKANWMFALEKKQREEEEKKTNDLTKHTLCACKWRRKRRKKRGENKMKRNGREEKRREIKKK